VKIATVDSGVDTTINDLKSHLGLTFTDDSKHFLCDARKGLREGRYGMNTLDAFQYFDNGGNLRTNDNYFEPVDIDGHGTFINSIIAGMAHHQIGNPQVDESLQTDPKNIALRQINVKFTQTRDGSCYLFDGLCGVHYAINKEAKVINVSWRAEGEDNMVRLFEPMLKALFKNNVLLVAGVGNDQKDLNLAQKSWPASLSNPNFNKLHSSNVISVGAWDTKTDMITKFSNYGESEVDIYAPGIDLEAIGLLKGIPTEVIGYGTSYATPFITRIAGILMGMYPKSKPEEIKEMIIENARLINSIPVISRDLQRRNLKKVRVLNYKLDLGLYTR
jgi:cell wall-associated protease